MTCIKPDLQLLQQKIEDLYNYREEYFLKVPEENFGSKDDAINSQASKILEELNQTCDKIEDKATFYFLKGWLLNIKDTFDKEVYDLLSKSIKLKPDYEAAWNELGECYFKKGDLKQALNCFEKVIQLNGNDKKALRNASIMLRSSPASGEEKQANLVKSINLAKRAVQCDLTDGLSWAILANAYLTLFFMATRHNQTALLKQCKSAYQKALLDERVRTKADVLFNYSSILQYEEEFELALDCLTKAAKYDQSWPEPRDRKRHIVNYITDICQKISDSASIKAKKLNSIKEGLNSEENKLKSQHANSTAMYGGVVKPVQQLQEGHNECLLLCKIVSYSTDAHSVFFCSVFYAIDSAGECVALFIYDLVKNKGPNLGDSVTVLRPFLKAHRLHIDGQQYHFKSILVVNPLEGILVNHKRLGLDSIAFPVVNVTLKSD